MSDPTCKPNRLSSDFRSDRSDRPVRFLKHCPLSRRDPIPEQLTKRTFICRYSSILYVIFICIFFFGLHSVYKFLLYVMLKFFICSMVIFKIVLLQVWLKIIENWLNFYVDGGPWRSGGKSLRAREWGHFGWQRDGERESTPWPSPCLVDILEPVPS
jgi:hypothetical protein